MKKILLLFLGIFFISFVHSALTDNLVSYYDFETGTGTTVADSLNLYNLTSNSSVWVTGKIGTYAMNFSRGSSQFARTTSNVTQLTGQDITINGWVYLIETSNQGSSPPTTAGIFKIGANFNNGNENNGMALDGLDVCSTNWVVSSPNTYSCAGSSSGDVGSWHMITLRWVASTKNLSIWRDSSLLTSVTTTHTLPAGEFWLAKSTQGDFFLAGILDEIGVWNKSLSSAEISQLYNGGTGLTYPFQVSGIPSITLTSPENNSYTTSSTTFSVIPTDTVDLTGLNVSIYGNWTGGWHLNSSNTSALNNTPTNFTISGIPDGKYIWNALVTDSQGNSSWASNNYTFIVDSTSPSTIFYYPSNNTFSNSLTQIFSFNFTDNNALKNTTLNIWNSGEIDINASSLCYQESVNISNQTGIDGDCGLNYNGNWSLNHTSIEYASGGSDSSACSGSLGNCSFDGSINSGFWTNNNSEIYVNYTKPINALSTSIYSVFYTFIGNSPATGVNESIPLSCFSQSQNLLRFKYVFVDSVTLDLYCYNSSWVLMDTLSTGLGSTALYEESIYWATPSKGITGISNSTSWSYTFSSDGVYKWNAYTCDQAGNCAFNSTNQTITIDTTIPTFTTIPNNDTITYPTDWTGEDFDASDTNLGSFSVNDSRFTINSTGWLDNIDTLSAGTYVINVSVNDSAGNKNSVTYLLTINKNSEVVYTFFNETSPINYPNSFKVYSNATSTFTLYRNGTSISNNSAQGLSAGTYNFTVIRTDQVNYSNITSTAFFTVSKISPSLSLSVTNSTYPTVGTINASESNSGDSDVNYTLYINGILYFTGSSINQNLVLSVGNYTIVYNTTGGTNYTSSSTTKLLSISKGTLFGSISGTTPIIYGTAGDINASESNSGDSDVNYTLYRNGSLISNPDIETLGAGLYTYIYNTTGGTNWTSNSSISTFTLTINQATPVITKSLNGSSNITIIFPEQVNASGSTTGGTINLFRNGTDVTSENNVYKELAVGYYEYLFNVTGNSNYTGISGEYLYVNITKNNGSCNIFFNETSPLNSNILFKVWSDCNSDFTLYRNGTSISNNSAQNLSDGTYNFTVIRTDQVNYSNIEDQKDFVIDSTVPTVEIGTNPIDNLNTNNNSITFDLRAYDNNGISYLALYGNWTGSWVANQTNSSPINATYWNITVSNIPEGKYVWGAWSNDTLNNEIFSSNRTFIVDKTNPLIDYGTNIEDDTANVSQNNIFINTTITESSIKDINYTISYSNGTTIQKVNFTSLVTNLNYKKIDLSTGLLGHYKLDTDSTTQVDSSGFGNDGTVTNATFNSTGKIGGAYSFGSSNSAINISNSTDFNFTNKNFTLSAWVNGINYSLSKVIISKGGGSSSSINYLLYIGDGISYFYIGNGTGFNSVNGGAVNTNQWYLLTGTLSGSNFSIYINGVLMDSSTFPGSVLNTIDQISIGSFGDVSLGGFPFNGTIDDVRIYNRTLNQDEISNLYSSGEGHQEELIIPQTLGDGDYLYYANISDLAGNTNSTSVRSIRLDTNSPITSSSSPSNNTNTSSDQNYTGSLTDNLGIKNSTLNILYQNNTIANSTAFTFLKNVISTPIGIVVTIADGIYKWFYETFDWAGNRDITQNKTITIDKTNPLIDYNPSSESNLSILSRTWILINISASDTNLNTIGLSWQNVNETFDSNDGDNYYENKSSLSDGNYSFYSWVNDSANNKNFTGIRTITIDTTPPVITITNPSASQTLIDNASIKLNFTKLDSTSIGYCWFSVTNSTDDLIISNQSISGCSNTTFNLPKSDSYNLTLYINDTIGNLNSTNVFFRISLESPAVNLLQPSDESYTNMNNTYFNFSVTDFDGIDYCDMYSNFSGTWDLNESFTFITSGVQKYTKKNLTEGTYIWNVNCTDNTGLSDFALNNYTIISDLTNPNATILSDNGTNITGLSLLFNYNITDDKEINSCAFTLRDSNGNLHNYNANTSMDCGYSSRTVTVFDSGTYTLYIQGVDTAGNIATDNITFTSTSQQSGSNAGGVSIKGLTQAENFSITTTNLKTESDLILPRHSSKPRTQDFVIINKGLNPITVTIACNVENRSLSSQNVNMCNYIKFPVESFTIPPNQQEIIQGKVFIYTPEDSKLGDNYFVNIVALSSKENSVSKLSIKTRVTFLGELLRWNYFPFQGSKLDSEKSSYPVAGVSLLISLLMFIISLVIFKRYNLDLTGLFISILVFILSFIVSMIIL